MSSVLLFVHILAAGAWFGTNVVQTVMNRRMQGEPDDLAASWLRSTVRFGTRIYTPAAVLLLITGIWMVATNDAYEFEHAFAIIGVVMVVIGALLGARVFGPLGEHAATLRDEGKAVQAGPLYRRLQTFGVVDTVLLVVTIAAMVGRWGA